MEFHCVYGGCHKRFKRKGDLTRHAILHSGLKPHVCDTCRKSFAQASALKTHMNVHTGAKPYKCLVKGCPARFGDPSSRTRHTKETHEIQTRYRCPMYNCSAAIKRGSSFRTHLRKVHGFMPDNFNIDDCSEPLMGTYEEFSPDPSSSSCESTPPSRTGPELSPSPYRESPVLDYYDPHSSPASDAPASRWYDAHGGLHSEFQEVKPVLLSLDHSDHVSPSVSPLSLSPCHSPPALCYPPDSPPPVLYCPPSSPSAEQNDCSSSDIASSPPLSLPSSQSPPYLTPESCVAALDYETPEQLWHAEGLFLNTETAGYPSISPYDWPVTVKGLELWSEPGPLHYYGHMLATGGPLQDPQLWDSSYDLYP